MKYVLSLILLSQFAISVDVDLALFNLTVLDKNGRTVTGLTAENFRVFEDGREETIKVFRPEDTPATVGFVIDNSGSMQNKRSDMVTAALAFVGASQGNDEMCAAHFGRAAVARIHGTKKCGSLGHVLGTSLRPHDILGVGAVLRFRLEM